MINKKIIIILLCILFFGAYIIPSKIGHNIQQVVYPKSQSDNVWIEQDILLALDGEENECFGHSVSICGDYAIIAAWNDDDNGGNSGSAYIFKRDGANWTQQAKLLPHDEAPGDSFGWSVSISSDYAIIGAFGDNNNQGSAYIFKREGTYWTEQDKLVALDGEEVDNFGYSVSIDGDYAIIGAYCHDHNVENSGSAYVFKRDDAAWVQQAELISQDVAEADHFGRSVSINGSYAVIGAPWDDDNGDTSGSAYIFKRDGSSWTQQAKLLPLDGDKDDFFGGSVSIGGDYAIIGAPEDEHNGDTSGSAYIFKREGTSWTQQAKLLPSNGGEMDEFGLPVSINGDYAVIGARWDHDNGFLSGSAYIFKRYDAFWFLQTKLLASDGDSYDFFGSSVSIDGDYAIIGADNNEINGSDNGSAYIFIKNESGNHPPFSPVISGPNSGKVGTPYTYTFTLIDPNCDDIAEYIVNWGDGPDETIVGPFPSGSTHTKDHNWTSQGIYIIKAKARDINGLESDRIEFTVNIGSDPEESELKIRFKMISIGKIRVNFKNIGSRDISEIKYNVTVKGRIFRLFPRIDFNASGTINNLAASGSKLEEIPHDSLKFRFCIAEVTIKATAGGETFLHKQFVVVIGRFVFARPILPFQP